MRLRGWKNVFAFTFIQQIKSRSFIIGTVVIALIVALIAALANIIPALLLGDALDEISSGEPQTLSVEKLYLNDRTGMDFDFTPVAVSMGIKYEAVSDEAADAKIQELAASSENAMVSVISYEESSGFGVESNYAGDNSDVNKSDCDTVNSMLVSNLKIQYLASLGLSADEVTVSLSSVHSSSAKAGEEPISMVREIANSVVPMISSLILFIFIFSYSQLVAQSVALEKSSRIMEYLLTSIKPLAVIAGKVLAMCCVSLMQFFIIGISGTLGFLISMPFGIFSKMGEIMNSVSAVGIQTAGILSDIQDVFGDIDPLSIVVMVVTFILGFLLYATFAGLTGASISKMEDLAAAMQPISIIGVLGFYLAYFPQVANIDGTDNSMTVLARYLPISSPFVLPSDYMLGKISLGETCLFMVILLAADILLMMLVAKVYEHIVLHTGNRLKISDMLKLAKNSK